MSKNGELSHVEAVDALYEQCRQHQGEPCSRLTKGQLGLIVDVIGADKLSISTKGVGEDATLPPERQERRENRNLRNRLTGAGIEVTDGEIGYTLSPDKANLHLTIAPHLSRSQLRLPRLRSAAKEREEEARKQWKAHSPLYRFILAVEGIVEEAGFNVRPGRGYEPRYVTTKGQEEAITAELRKRIAPLFKGGEDDFTITARERGDGLKRGEVELAITPRQPENLEERLIDGKAREMASKRGYTWVERAVNHHTLLENEIAQQRRHTLTRPSHLR